MKTKILNGSELAGYIKERQARVVRNLRTKHIQPKLVILRDSDNPVITKYVKLKCRYGQDIGVEVEDKYTSGLEAMKKAILEANTNRAVSGIIVQLPLQEKAWTDEIVSLITPEKDVDGLSGKGKFDSATATAINWLLAGNGVELAQKKIAIVGRGRLVGAPLIKMWQNSGYDVTVFGHTDDLKQLINYTVIVTATGVPHLVTSEMIASGAVVVDAGTASEDGKLLGDVDDTVRARTDLAAITPKIGGVGPLTVSVLFENVIKATEK